jgi:amino acid adenylation domain-containing protein
MSTSDITNEELESRRARLSTAKRELLERRLRGLGTDAPRAQAITRREESTRPAALSFAQERLWFLDQLEPGSAAYNIPTAVRLKGQLDIEILRRCFDEIVRRHEALRTSFVPVDERPAQVVAPSLELNIPVTDLCGLAETECETAAARIALEEGRAPFDLARPPLLRVRLLRLSPREHVLLLTMHHIVSDAWSMGVLVREASALYEAFAGGRPSPLPPPPVQYADYAEWQRRWLTGDALENQIRYWKQQLGGVPPVLELPTDRPRPESQDFRGAAISFRLTPELSSALKALGRREGVTLYMTLLAAFQTLLHRLASQDDLAVGAPIANRNRAETEDLIGFFVNTLVLRARFTGDPTFRELLAQVRETTLGAYERQDLPFERLVEELQPERDRSRNPLVQVVFDLQNVPAPSVELPGLVLSAEDHTSTTTRFDLELHVWDAPEGLRGELIYSTALFEHDTAARMLRYFQTLLRGVSDDAGARISELELLDEAERRELLAACHGTRRPYPREACAHELFEAQAERTPEAVALEHEGERVSYRELNERANRLARRLRAWGVSADARVGLCVGRSVEMIVGMLGILKAGAAYVPLDAAQPLSRLLFMIEDTRAQLIVSVERLEGMLPACNVPVVMLDADRPEIDAEPEGNLSLPLAADNLAYVTYTSGSTGEPKGVAVTHRGVVRLVKENDYARFARDEVFLQLAPLAFDASTFEIWGALLSGARLILMPAGQSSLAEIGAVVRAQGVTTLWLTAGLFHLMVDEQLEDLMSLRQLLAGGDVLSVTHARKFLDAAHGRCALINGYGPTEGTTFTCCRRLEAGDLLGASAPIGRPIANTQVYILDRRLRLVPPGASGELYIGGDGLSRGYLSRPAQTAARFIPDPFSGEAGARLYRTGDLARLRSDGNLAFLGRRDYQVKVRGFRVEPGEIEAALERHPSVREAVVVARGEPAEDKRLVAYFVGEEGGAPEAELLQEFLKKRLPDYMLPSSFVRLEQLPLTPNGKVDRRSLPRADASRPARAEDRAAPRTPVEELLARVCVELLKVETVGPHEDFFALGGHSLLATQFVSRVRRHFGVELSLGSFFEAPTVAAQAALVEAAMRAEAGTPAPPVTPAPRAVAPPLSFAQQRLWFLHELEPSTSAYNIPTAVRLTGRLDAAALRRAVAEVVRRHESLRTSFRVTDGRPVQVIDPEGDFEWRTLDLGSRPAAALLEEARRVAEEEARRPFDLARGPLLRAALLRLADDEHVLAVIMHHIVSDGWSMSVLVREVAAFYKAYGDGAPGQSRTLPPLPIQYADFAVWQRRWLAGGVLEKRLDYWRRQLDGGDLPPLELPIDRPRPEVQSFRGASRSALFPRSLSDALNVVCRTEGVTLFMLLLAAFKVLLRRYTGQTDIVVGSPIANRNREELEPLIGFFVNTLVLRADLSGNPTFAELLGRVRRVALDAYTHQDLPFEQLVEELQPERSLSRNPLFQVMFQLENTPKEELPLSGVGLHPLELERVASQFDLSLDVTEGPQGLVAVAEYSTDLFKGETVARLLGHWHVLLEAVAADPHRRIDELPLLDDAGHDEVLAAWNETEAEYARDTCVHELFEAQAERTPEAVALECSGERVSYRELNERANRLAHYLNRLGVGPEMLVGVMPERSAEMIVSLLGVLKAGAAYVPLDHAYPPRRLAFMLSDTGASVLLTSRRLAGRVTPGGARLVCLDAEAEAITRQPSTNPSGRVAADNLAYVVYTSGSTGEPKGVAVTHRSLVNHAVAFADRYVLRPGERVLQFASVSFDVAAEEIFPTLAGGATVVLGGGANAEARESLLEFVRRERLTVLNLPAARWHEWTKEIAAAGAALPDELRLVVVGSENVSREAFERWRKLSGVRLINAYGTSETTITSALYEPPPGGEAAGGSASLPIGRPVANTRLYVLDAGMRPVPVGVAGELFVGGDGVARGYLNRPALTAPRFVPDPFSGEPGARLYRTGDLARRLPEGDLEFLGRADGQLKLRGFRIEPGEVGAVLERHPAVREALVVAREDAPGDARLVAYLVTRAPDEIDDQRLRVSELESEQLAQWRTVHDDEVFNEVSAREDSTFNVSGWNSSYTGLPIPAEEMREWVDDAVREILARGPRRVLEIGCGTGLLLFRLAPLCSAFTGTDFSPSALDFVRRGMRADAGRFAHVTLDERNADDFEGFEAEAFDAVILNSVAQYFPSIDYLVRVLTGAVERTAPGGFVFVGDVRSLPLLEAFHSSVELFNAEDALRAAELRRRVRARVEREEELVIDPAFFFALRQRLPRISRVLILPKRGSHHNEMTKYRYQVILHVGDPGDEPAPEGVSDAAWLDWREARLDLAALRELLAEKRPRALGVGGLTNARLVADVWAARALSELDDSATVGALRESTKRVQEEPAADPEELHRLGDELGYEARFSWARHGPGGDFDVWLRRRDAASSVSASRAEFFPEPNAAEKGLGEYANSPLRARLASRLVLELRSHAKDRLPDYMIPSSFVLLDKLPLTPSGKHDRRALPPPDGLRPGWRTAFVAPRTPTEKALAESWAGLLGESQIGADDNFFDLGGHSLLATQLLSRVRETFGVELSLRQLFEQPTVAGLAHLIEEATRAAAEPRPPEIGRVARGARRLKRPARPAPEK